ncbi:MAG TPA: alkaline phosphatase family protein [Phycisphaerae bacterium]|nr:alkaline phosphatase family protein [Phycisphaerae bacterium]
MQSAGSAAGAAMLAGMPRRLAAQEVPADSANDRPAGPITYRPGKPGQRPRLVVWITLDAMRGDIPLRLRNPATRAGLGFLLDNGLYYSNAHFGHSTTFTAVGHAALFTGAHSAQHGIAGNDWHIIETGMNIYCVQDDAHPVLHGVKSKFGGYSPNNLAATTIGDELVLASGGRSRVFSVSGKDRGAIMGGGHLGKAFWYAKEAGGFVTSDYYYKDYPAWYGRWATTAPVDACRDRVWALIDTPATYRNRDRDDVRFEKGYRHLGRTFPHAMAADKPADLYAALPYSPFLDELTAQLATDILRHEKLGHGEATDLLAVSLSATDYIHHNWGPDCLEAEDNVRRLDALLRGFFAFIDQHVGLDNTLLVVSADHGMDAIPEYKKSLGCDAGRHYPEKFLRAINDRLRKRFGINRDLAKVFWNPSIYLDVEAIGVLNLDRATVERAAAEEVFKVPGFAMAVPRTDMLAGRITDTPITRRMQRSFHPTRSGHVIVIPSQHWYLYPEPDAHAAMHGTPYAYDTFVPIFVAGGGLRPGTIRRPVQPEDLASTVAAVLGLAPPSGNTGTPLAEVVEATQAPCLAPTPTE